MNDPNFVTEDHQTYRRDEEKIPSSPILTVEHPSSPSTKGCAESPCSAVSIRDLECDVENEWQTAQDWIEDKGYKEAAYYLQRTIDAAYALRNEAMTKLPRTMEYRKGTPTCTHCKRYWGACKCDDK